MSKADKYDPWDDLLADAKLMSSSGQGGCGAGKLIQSLSEHALGQVEYALANPELQTSAILKAIKARVKTDLSAYTLRRHRKGDCACGKGM